jgi:integrase
MGRSMTNTKPERVERGVYVRVKNGKEEFGSRCDEIDGTTQWRWGFSSQAKARADYHARRTKVRHRREAGGDITPTKDTIAVLRDAYLLSIKGKRIAYADRKRHLDFWAERFKKQLILTIQPVQVEHALADLKAQHGLSNATANRYAESLRRLMRKMVTPLAWVQEFWRKVELYDEPRPLPNPLSEERENQLYAALDVQDALYARLDVLTGLRLTQFFTLRWEYLWWDQALLDLPAFKRHPPRRLPLTQEAMAILSVLWDQQGRPKEGWVFPVRRPHWAGVVGKLRAWHQKAEPLIDRDRHINAHNWYNRRYHPAVITAGLDGVTFHTLRKTWASRLGPFVPERILQILGGWQSVEPVKHYCSPFDGAIRDAIERAHVAQQSVEKVSSGHFPAVGKMAELIKRQQESPRSSVG